MNLWNDQPKFWLWHTVRPVHSIYLIYPTLIGPQYFPSGPVHSIYLIKRKWKRLWRSTGPVASGVPPIPSRCSKPRALSGPQYFSSRPVYSIYLLAGSTNPWKWKGSVEPVNLFNISHPKWQNFDKNWLKMFPLTKRHYHSYLSYIKSNWYAKFYIIMARNKIPIYVLGHK